MSKILVAYFSRKGQNYWIDGIKDIPKGNAQRASEAIAEAVGGDLFEIEREEDYSEIYNECVEEAVSELRSNARPKLVGGLDNMDEYDTVFLAYPNWCGTMPMPVFTFLESHDMTGKVVIPFCSHEGSGLHNSIRDLKLLCQKSVIKNGLAVLGHETEKAEGRIKKWAAQSLK